MRLVCNTKTLHTSLIINIVKSITEPLLYLNKARCHHQYVDFVTLRANYSLISLNYSKHLGLCQGLLLYLSGLLFIILVYYYTYQYQFMKY